MLNPTCCSSVLFTSLIKTPNSQSEVAGLRLGRLLSAMTFFVAHSVMRTQFIFIAICHVADFRIDFWYRLYCRNAETYCCVGVHRDRVVAGLLRHTGDGRQHARG